MQFEEELFFRKLAREEELITISQLEECLEIQRNNPTATSLFVIMIEKGYIYHKNMGKILKRVPPHMRDPVLSAKKTTKKFGELCVEKGFASTDQVAECLSIQERLRREGKHFRLGQILIEKKYVATRQAQVILEIQGKKILRCAACETKYNIRNYKSHKKYRCPKCSRDLSTFQPSGVSMSVDRSFMTRETVEVDDESLNLINKRIGDYTVTELLGEGGMANVYKVISQFRKRPRALKVMKTQAGAERFTREFENASALRHPNIIRVYERGVEDGNPYFFMEYIEGGTLAKRIEKMGVISLKEGLSCLRQVAMGLKYAHENSIVHRDIKPSNIMLSSDSTKKMAVKITDFGIARAVSDTHITMTGQLVGTFKYMAPEYIKGRNIDGKNDIFSLGIAAYEIFTGQEPFAVEAPVGYLFVNIKEQAPDIHQLNPDLPKELSLIIQQMIAKDPNKRYDAAALLRDLDRMTRYLQSKGQLWGNDDKTSVFYSRAKFHRIKGLWGKLSQKLVGAGEEEVAQEEKPGRRAVNVIADDQFQVGETEEVGKDVTAQKQYEFAVALLNKGDIEAAQKNLEALIEVFPGTPWAGRAKQKLTNLTIGNIESEDLSSSQNQGKKKNLHKPTS